MLAPQQLRPASARRAVRGPRTAPATPVYHRTARPLLVRNGGTVSAPSGLAAELKRGLSTICRMLHGNGDELDGAMNEPTFDAAAVADAAWHAEGGVDDVASAPYAPPPPPPAAALAAPDPLLAQAAANANGHAFIKVVGAGGGGGNAIARMITTGLQNVEFWAVNTDAQALASNICPNKLQIGTALTRGLGTGGKPSLGEQAAQESAAELGRLVSGADMLFITAGMGGGTGTGAAPVIARLAKDAGILTVGIVSFPFSFEGRRRAGQALEGIETLRSNVDTLIVIPNDRLLDAVGGGATSLTEAFALADSVLRQGVGGITEIVTTPGLINVDFADVKAIMRNSGTAMLGVGCGSGPGRALQAAGAATSAPLIQSTIERATGIVYNITGNGSLTLAEVNAISEVVTSLADPSCNIIFGAVIDPECPPDEIRVTIIATGFSQSFEEALLSGRSEATAGMAGAARAAGRGRGAQPDAPEASPAAQEPAAGAAQQTGQSWRPSFRGRTIL